VPSFDNLQFAFPNYPVSIFENVDDIGQPYSIEQWGDLGTPDFPVLTDDGDGANLLNLFGNNYTWSIIIGPDMVVKISGVFDLNIYMVELVLDEYEMFFDNPPTNFQLGDVNMDEMINITDILLIINHIVGINSINLTQLHLADLNDDNVISVLDIIQIVNIILGNRGEDATFANYDNKNNVLSMKTDGIIGGIQMTISHDSNFDIELSEYSFVSKFQTNGNLTEIIIIAPEDGILFKTNSEFKIEKLDTYNSIEKIISNFVELNDFQISAFPNPFNPKTLISFEIKIDGIIDLEIFNLNGQSVYSQNNQFYFAGSHSIVWDASNHPTGIYLLNINSNNQIKSEKLMLIK
jgi:hypothetical protein